MPLAARMRSNLASAAGFGALSVLPFVAYVAFLYLWLGSIAKGTLLEWVPFSGLVGSRDWELKRQGVVIATVVVPALMFAGLALVALRNGIRRVEFAYLLANVLLFVVLLHRLSYGDGYTSVGSSRDGRHPRRGALRPLAFEPGAPRAARPRRVVRPLAVDVAGHLRLRVRRLSWEHGRRRLGPEPSERSVTVVGGVSLGRGSLSLCSHGSCCRPSSG